MNIYVASDHAGFQLKEHIKLFLRDQMYKVIDVGTDSTKSVNWAEFGAKAAKDVSENFENSIGIIVCGSGIGMSIVSNKFRNIRAALCRDKNDAEMARKHNNANILNLGERTTDFKEAISIVEVFLKTEFEGGRHQERLDYLQNIVEENNLKEKYNVK